MKIYVDKLPQGCYCCRYNRTINSERVCTLVYYRVGYMKYRAIECPLRPISDYTDEILTKVEQLIDEKLKDSSVKPEILSEIPTVDSNVSKKTKEKISVDSESEVTKSTGKKKSVSKSSEFSKNVRVLENKISKAVQPHVCNYCNENILKNERYNYLKAVVNGKFTSIKLHQKCYDDTDGEILTRYLEV